MEKTLYVRERREGELLQEGLQVTRTTRNHVYYKYKGDDGKWYVLHMALSGNLDITSADLLTEE